MGKEAIRAAFVQQKKNKITALEISIQNLKSQSRECPRPKKDDAGPSAERAYIETQRKRQETSLRYTKSCCDSLRSLPIDTMENIGLGSLVTVRERKSGELSTYLIIANGGGCCLQHEGRKITCISLQAPLGQELINKTTKATFSCKEKTYQVVSVE